MLSQKPWPNSAVTSLAKCCPIMVMGIVGPPTFRTATVGVIPVTSGGCGVTGVSGGLGFFVAVAVGGGGVGVHVAVAVGIGGVEVTVDADGVGVGVDVNVGDGSTVPVGVPIGVPGMGERETSAPIVAVI